MIHADTFRRKLSDLTANLKDRETGFTEASARAAMYYRLLHRAQVNETDFVEACDRLLFSDTWFPTIARLLEVIDACARDRRLRERATQPIPSTRPLVCGTCHGARYVRLGGYSPSTRPDSLPVGADGTRTRPCPSCTTHGQYDPAAERQAIATHGGAPHPNAEVRVDLSRVTWPAQMAELRDPDTGALDLDRLYRRSRELRGLDPLGDDRPASVHGWRAVGRTR